MSLSSVHLIWIVKSFWQTETPAANSKNVRLRYPCYAVIIFMFLRFYGLLTKLIESTVSQYVNWDTDLCTSSDHNSILVCICRSEVTQDLLRWHMSLIFILPSWVCVIQCTKTESPKCSPTVEAFRYYLLSISFMKALLCHPLPVLHWVILINDKPL